LRPWLFLAFSFLFVGEARADDLRLDGKFLQGGLVQGTVPAGTEITFEGQPVRVSAKGRFLIGFSRNAGPTLSLAVRLPDGRQINKALKIETRKYQIQRIDGLRREMVTPPKAVYNRIRAENAIITNARAKDTAEDHFESGWIWPAQGRISGVYGSQRILNGKPRRPHFGLDVAAPVGTPVISPADAVVALAHQDMYYTGGTLILDHGHGLTSAMLHMDTLEVVTGDFVRKGQRIGTIGKTGRATGPHLDWRVNLFKACLDPALLVPPMPTPKQK
jgi:murein DD-endopeptidase MepM/ murein hydrolase activator NlpD